MGSGGNNPVCTHCGSTKSPLWRRGVHSEMLCNACGLYWKHHGTYRPLSLKAVADRKETPRSKSPVEALPPKRDSTLRRLKSALEAGVVESSARRKMIPIKSKNSVGKIALPASVFLPTRSGRLRGEPIFAPELPASVGSANVRLVPAEIRESSSFDSRPLQEGGELPFLPSKSALVTTKYIMFRGRLLFVGDHVAVRGDDAQVYFAVVHDFWMIPTGQKYLKLQWLLPKNKFALQIDGPKESIDPSFFTLGPMHERAEQIESIIDVFFSPQLLRRPLEGPSLPPTVPSLSRRTSLDSPSAGWLIPRAAQSLSDSELDISTTPLDPRRELLQQPNILDDVEMAHLLCSMS